MRNYIRADIMTGGEYYQNREIFSIVDFTNSEFSGDTVKGTIEVGGIEYPFEYMYI